MAAVALAARRFRGPSEVREASCTSRVRPVIVQKDGMAMFEGELLDPGTGVVIPQEDAYETIHAKVREERLGSVTRFKRFPRFRKRITPS